ncbi:MULTISPECIES: hypothetical protein [Tepidanaerobacter]|uniref:Uncharacterized protein n=1 Tax=Tepidanaerobacter syntrophicus TaxID=224999 RepID=A0A0U9HH37_9FIRM|nr:MULTISPECIES: hypothetical protein [Tepidanaerobacter]GAQ26194.1 hypothetical protein TSYNT_9458 [Tepidanaerobacter syntrophicus]GLI19182.1 hypothetical protein TSYNTROPHJE_09950 [Tepidanaerobacter syntrophicus]GLI50186.1 hypothetical protein TSYNTROOL_02720 [Tepidanaerobacter syntrophicus]HHV83592.1 HAD-IG family 5'-nucleotidase [Tepidanaerobacter syntrophicus]
MDAEKEIHELKQKIDKAKAMRYKAEVRLEELQKQRQLILDELEKLNVKPEELDKEIEKASKEIEDLLKKAKELLPKDLEA